MVFLVVGLGNPGEKYKHNWHNCGFMALEVLSQRQQISVKKSKFIGEYGKGKISGRDVILLRPHTFMNLSGQSVRAAVDFYKIPPEKIIVIYDDIDLPVGHMRVRDSGGAGTHNGMKSVIQSLATQEFCRVRIGCGPVPEHWGLADYVLSDIPKAQQQTMFDMFVQAAEAVEAKIEAFDD